MGRDRDAGNAMRPSRYRRIPDDRPGLYGPWGVADLEAEAGAPPAVLDAFVVLDGEEGISIRGFDRMPPFLMNVPTDTDLWMFVSSAGGLTAGRRDPDQPRGTIERHRRQELEVGAAKHGFFEIGGQPGDVVQHVVPTQRFEPIQRRIESG